MSSGNDYGLSNEQKIFIKQKVQKLGSIYAVNSLYSQDCPVDKYARDIAREIFAHDNNSDKEHPTPIPEYKDSLTLEEKRLIAERRKRLSMKKKREIKDRPSWVDSLTQEEKRLIAEGRKRLCVKKKREIKIKDRPSRGRAIYTHYHYSDLHNKS